MSLTLVLVAACHGALPAAAVDAVRAALHVAGGRSGPAHWLSPERAAGVGVSGLAAPAAVSAAREALDGAPVDVLAPPGGSPIKRLLVADMDSTIVAEETLDRMAELAGVADRVVPITARAMNGELDFPAALRERVALLAGQPAALVDRALADVRLMPGARALLATMRRDGAWTVLVSGGFEPFVAAVACELGFHETRANRLEVVEGRLTGRVLGEIVTRETKRDLLVAARDRLGLHPAATLAVGDGANDLPMLLEAGLGIAFRAKPTVRARAAATVDHADLSALLYAQGYPDRDIAWPEDDRPTLALPPPPDGVAGAGLPTSGEA